ncbi:hypothetical protein [Rhodoplanes azumiensis]|uniref:Uncharacterized protein n=1 Tax=Rhodoplanes azumiensis TaxID=1897628 RepID=A0ABW5AG30_9BRAD
MPGSRRDTTNEDGEGTPTVARVTLAVGRLRLSTETRASGDAAPPHLRLGRRPNVDLDPDLGIRLPRLP